jgi:hypothetical protein
MRAALAIVRQITAGTVEMRLDDMQDESGRDRGVERVPCGTLSPDSFMAWARLLVGLGVEVEVGEVGVACGAGGASGEAGVDEPLRVLQRR